MLHIVINHGVVAQVYELAKTPDQPPRVLNLEEDYKVEYLQDYEVEDNSGLEDKLSPRNQDGWLTPKVYKGKSESEE